jgi:PAS domain S-box-containing protein
MPIATIDLSEGMIVAPSPELCEFLGISADGRIRVKGWLEELGKLEEIAKSCDKYPILIKILKNKYPFHIGIFPLRFIENSEHLLEVCLFDANAEFNRREQFENYVNVIKVLANNAGSVIVLSAEGAILEGSMELFSLWGFTLEKIKGKQFTTLISPTHKQTVNEQLEQMSGFNSDVFCMRHDGSQFIADIITERQVYKRTTYILTRIISAELSFNEAIFKEKAKHSANYIPSIVAIVNKNDILFANHLFLDFFDVSDLQSFKKRYGQLEEQFTPRRGFLHSVNGDWLERIEIFKRNNYVTKVLIYSVKRAEYRTFILLFQKMQKNKTYFLLFVDITDIDNLQFVLQDTNVLLEKEVEIQSRQRRETAMLLKQQEELLIQQSKVATMGNLVNIVTHQWKQPLSTMLMLAYNILDELNAKGENTDARAAVTNIIKQAEFMTSTIEDFRNFFKPSKTFVKFDVTEPLESVVNLLKPLLAHRHITLHRHYPNPCPLALGLPNELKQVLMSIVINAKDAISAQNKENGNISIDVLDDNDSIKIKIKDDGGGISMDIIDKIFEPFVSSKLNGSTGTGLYIAKVAMTNMNGAVTAENDENGAIFTLTISKA